MAQKTYTLTMSKEQKERTQMMSLPIEYDELREHRIQHPPSVHIARGYQSYLPFLDDGRPLICISDWQYETRTQEYLWRKAIEILHREIGQEVVERSVVLVAGDMASCDNALRGSASDDASNLEWLRRSVPRGSVYIIYGNHDLVAKEHLSMTNHDGTHCYLPHGGTTTVSFGLDTVDKSDKQRVVNVESLLADICTVSNTSDRNEWNARHVKQPTVQVAPGMTKEERAALYAQISFQKIPKKSTRERRDKQWQQQNPEQARLAVAMTKIFEKTSASTSSQAVNESIEVRIGAAHGIPSKQTMGLQKLHRTEYFEAVRQACTEPVDVLVTHSNPCLPGQERLVLGDDPKRLVSEFLHSSAKLYVHGHMHTEPAVSILEGSGKVVVNADCRVVAFVPTSHCS